MPVINKLFKFFICTFEVSEFIYDFLSNISCIINTKHKHDFFCFAWFKFKITLNCSTRVISVCFRVCTSTVNNSLWMFVRTISSNKCFTACIKTGHWCTNKGYPLAHICTTNIPFWVLDVKIILNRIAEKIISNFFTFYNE